jgi:hypothetical protein
MRKVKAFDKIVIVLSVNQVVYLIACLVSGAVEEASDSVSLLAKEITRVGEFKDMIDAEKRAHSCSHRSVKCFLAKLTG